MEGHDLPPDLIQTLVRWSPTSDEELRLRLYTGERAQLGRWAPPSSSCAPSSTSPTSTSASTLSSSWPLSRRRPPPSSSPSPPWRSPARSSAAAASLQEASGGRAQDRQPHERRHLPRWRPGLDTTLRPSCLYRSVSSKDASLLLPLLPMLLWVWRRMRSSEEEMELMLMPPPLAALAARTPSERMISWTTKWSSVVLPSASLRRVSSLKARNRPH